MECKKGKRQVSCLVVRSVNFDTLSQRSIHWAAIQLDGTLEMMEKYVKRHQF